MTDERARGAERHVEAVESPEADGGAAAATPSSPRDDEIGGPREDDAAPGSTGRVLARSAACFVASSAAAGILGSAAVALELYPGWTSRTLLGLLGCALGAGALAGVLQVVELRAARGARWRPLAWLWVQTWVLSIAGLCAALPQFHYAAAPASEGTAAAWGIASSLTAEQVQAFVCLFALVALPFAWIGLGRMRRLPLLSQIGLATALSTLVPVVLGSIYVIFIYGEDGLPDSARAAQGFVRGLLLGLLGGLVLVNVGLSVVVPCVYSAADRLLEHVTRRLEGR